jgi:L-malate glycosyltransferase
VLKKLLFVFNGPIFGGAERHTFDLALSLLNHGFNVQIFAMKAGPLLAPEPLIMVQPSKPRSLMGRITDLSRYIKTEQPDLIICVNERPVFASYAARFIARLNTPIAAILHSTILKSRKEKLFQIVYTPILNEIESVIFISHNQKKYWLQNGMKPRKNTVILNGIDITRFSPSICASHRDRMRASLGFAPDDLVIGLSAVMRSEKNHLQLLDALYRLRQEGTQAKLLYVGDGALRTIIEARVKALNLENHVVFAGMQADVRPFLSTFDIGVICSTSVETLSLSALEIMAMGIPMVMSDIGGASEIIDANNGRLFVANDDKGLYEALLSLINFNIRILAGQSARAKVEKHFNHSTMSLFYKNHLANLCK